MQPVADRSTRLAYQPALDGVRAFAVVAVLLFHAGVPGFDGGYLGVSVFFTLSGFLITSLLVNEHDQTGTIRLGAFYGRRLRRLLPASVVTIAAIVVASRVTDWFDGVASLRAHVLGAVFQVANWVFLAGEGSYQDLLADTGGTPSPLEHFWSLAIEEQFYWLWPVCMLGLLGVARTRRARTAAVGGITVAFMAAAPVIAAVWGPDAAYWATPARLSEILVGAWLAVVLSGRAVPTRSALLAPIAFMALAVAVVVFPAASGPAYEGALPLVAVASGALLVGLQAPGPLRDVCALAPLVWIGKVSYGVYLYHWPVYVVLDADRTGLGELPLTIVRLAVTGAISAASYVLVEQPIRQARWSFRPTVALAAVASGAVAAAAVLVVPTALGNYWETDAAIAEAATIDVGDTTPLVPLAAPSTTSVATTVGTSASASEPSTTADPASAPTTPAASTAPSSTPTPSNPTPSNPTPSSPTPTPPTTFAPSTTIPPLPEPARPVRILVVGDSTAEAMGNGLVRWAAANPDLGQVELEFERGCGVLRGGDRWVDAWEPVPERCDRWLTETVPSRAAALSPDVVMVLVTPWDVLDRRWDGDAAVTPFDREFADRLAADYDALLSSLADQGVPTVAWARPPVPNPLWLNLEGGQTDPARHAVVDGIIDDVQTLHPDLLDVVPLRDWHTDEQLDDDHDVRPDGVHWTPETAEAIADAYLGEQLVRAALGLALR